MPFHGQVMMSLEKPVFPFLHHTSLDWCSFPEFVFLEMTGLEHVWLVPNAVRCMENRSPYYSALQNQWNTLQ